MSARRIADEFLPCVLQVLQVEEIHVECIGGTFDMSAAAVQPRYICDQNRCPICISTCKSTLCCSTAGERLLAVRNTLAIGVLRVHRFCASGDEVRRGARPGVMYLHRHKISCLRKRNHLLLCQVVSTAIDWYDMRRAPS